MINQKIKKLPSSTVLHGFDTMCLAYKRSCALKKQKKEQRKSVNLKANERFPSFVC